MYRSVRHDYVYYPSSWYDSSTGRNYESGYYDELGNHYDHVVIKKDNQYETRASCDYCGTEIKLNWTEGALPSCPNCGALLKEITDNAIVEEEIKDVPQYATNASYSGRRRSPVGIILIIVMFMTIGPIFLAGIFSSLRNNLYNDYAKTSSYTVNEEEEVDSIYVEEIGRDCEWNSEYESYYDKKSDCYFWYKEDTNEWQYWYEGISSDYGDYGWMEYDYGDGNWYIETSSGNWEILPDKYDTSKLWHFYEHGTGKYNDETSLYVEAIGRTCEFDEAFGNYYDPETKCEFWYNDLVDPPVWQYWYDGISSDYGDYGWMEYNEDEECWYIEESDCNWIKLPDSYDDSELWHIE